MYVGQPVSHSLYIYIFIYIFLILYDIKDIKIKIIYIKD
uniref:Uncharacterized protein n=1 Tax=uncultured bacterium contig00013 TaxID=1181504 RepID=A0A806K0R6_9BACT|nr:hypothetical protein [uncultured bacterium contig00013]